MEKRETSSDPNYSGNYLNYACKFVVHASSNLRVSQGDLTIEIRDNSPDFYRRDVPVYIKVPFSPSRKVECGNSISFVQGSARIHKGYVEYPQLGTYIPFGALYDGILTNYFVQKSSNSGIVYVSEELVGQATLDQTMIKPSIKSAFPSIDWTNQVTVTDFIFAKSVSSTFIVQPHASTFVDIHSGYIAINTALVQVCGSGSIYNCVFTKAAILGNLVKNVKTQTYNTCSQNVRLTSVITRDLHSFAHGSQVIPRIKKD